MAKLDNGFTIEEVLAFRDECRTPEEREDVAFITQIKNTKDIARMRKRMDHLEQRVMYMLWLIIAVLFGMPVVLIVAGVIIAGFVRG